MRKLFASLFLVLSLAAGFVVPTFAQSVTTDPALTGLPQAPGSKTSANSVSVTPASDATFTTTVSSGTITITATPSVGYLLTATATRPANTTTYTAGDVIGGSPTAVITFTSASPPTAGASLMLTSCDLQIAATAVPSGMGNMRAQLYSVTPPSALADNAAWDLPSGDRSAYLGYVDFGTPVDVGATLFVQVDQINKQVKLAAAETTLYLYLYSAGGFAPASNSEVYTIRCRAVGL